MKSLLLKRILLGIGWLMLFGSQFIYAGGMDTKLWDMDALRDVWVAWTATAEDWGDSSLIGIIKSFINWVLGMLGLIALVVLIRGGFQMVTAAGNEEKYKSGFTILKQAAVWLTFIWLSFFMVSMIFRLLGTVGAKD